MSNNIPPEEAHTEASPHGVSDDSHQQAEIEAVKTRLKWFNSPKGFGFVVPEDEQHIDAFIHITTLQRAGIDELGEGACLLCEMEEGPKGAQVKEVIKMIDIGVQPEPIKSDQTAASMPHVPPTTLEGAVKWYKPDKGFGFITPDDGLKDVFVHKSCLDQLGLDMLETGMRVSMEVKAVPKGREVLSLALIDISAAGADTAAEE